MSRLEESRRRALSALGQVLRSHGAAAPAPSTSAPAPRELPVPPSFRPAALPVSASAELPPVWAVVPHRDREGEDSGRGFVARRAAAVAADGSLALPSPYRGAPVVRTFSSTSAANHLANQMSGLAPKVKIGRLVAAKRIAEALEAKGYTVQVKPKRARPGQSYFIDARKGIDTGLIAVSDTGAIDFWRDFQEGSFATRAAAKEAREAVVYALAGDEPDPSADPRAKRIARLAAAELIAKALRKAGWEAELRWDIERPQETITVRASKGKSVGFVGVRFNGEVEREGAFSRDDAIADLVDDALQGALPDPALNPPPQRRLTITARDAAFEVASLLQDEHRGLEAQGASWYTDAELVGGRDKPSAVDVFRREPHPTHGAEVPFRRHLGRLLILDDGGFDFVDFDLENEARMRAVVTRALAGRTIVPSAKGASS